MKRQTRRLKAQSCSSESLEARTLLTTFTLDNGLLTVNGTDNNDNIEVRDNGNGEYRVIVGADAGLVPISDVDRIQVIARGGNDRIELSGIHVGAEIGAGAGDDTVFGGFFNDTIRGAGGNDELHGSRGQDFVDGGSGDDTLEGDAGNDTLFGANGEDVLEAGSGHDSIVGGTDRRRS